MKPYYVGTSYQWNKCTQYFCCKFNAFNSFIANECTNMWIYNVFSSNKIH